MALLVEEGREPANWSNVALTTCNQSDVRQNWGMWSDSNGFQALKYQGSPSSIGWCVQPDGAKPWLDVTPGVWACQDAWPEAVTLLPGSAGGKKMQWNMKSGGGGLLCLSLPASPTKTAQPTVQQLAWQDLEQGALFQYNIGESLSMQLHFAHMTTSKRTDCHSIMRQVNMTRSVGATHAATPHCLLLPRLYSTLRS
jgi:hypothetical protein